jgi:hypothetical protein
MNALCESLQKQKNFPTTAPNFSNSTALSVVSQASPASLSDSSSMKIKTDKQAALVV